MLDEQTFQQHIAALEAENARLVALQQHMEQEVYRLSLQLAESYLHRMHTSNPSKYDDVLVPYRAIFEQFFFPLAVYRADGMLVAINYQQKRRMHFAHGALIGKYNILESAEEVTDGCRQCFREALQGKIGHKYTDHQPDSLPTTMYVPIYERIGLLRYVIEMHVHIPDLPMMETQLC